jgi:hypothetical protein
MSDSKDPLGNIAKILDSKTAEKLYDDMIAPGAKEAGTIGRQVVDGLGLFAGLFRLMSIARQRLDRWCETITNRVPPERQVEAPSMIAGPVLETLRFVDENSMCEEMLLNLLTAAIDMSRQESAHPAYPQIIRSLSAQEACFFYDLAQTNGISIEMPRGTPCAYGILVQKQLPEWKHLSHDQIHGCLNHLESLALIGCSVVKPRRAKANVSCASIAATAFGRNFVRVCFPSGERIAKAKAELEKNKQRR